MPLENTNYTVWLTLNRVEDHHTGEIFEINGTVQQINEYNVNEKVVVDIITDHVYFESSAGRVSVHGKIFEGFANVQTNNCEVKPWSIFVNLSSNLWPGQYRIEARTSQNYVSKTFNITSSISEPLKKEV
jgi:hypothetical protein